MDVFLGQQDTEGGSPLFLILMMVALFAMIYFLFIRPNRRRKLVMESLQSKLAVGDEVMTSSGLYGTVAELDEKTVILETSEDVYSRYARAAIVEVVSSASAGEEETAPEIPNPIEQRDAKD